jgi:16S rRNA (cytosine967-C5)-methyltransferase
VKARPRKPTDARSAALAILQGVRDGAPFDVALDKAVTLLAEDDRRLAHELAAGVLRERAPLDLLLTPHVARGWDAVQPLLQDVLRLGAYQLAALDRIPAHAAVSETVELARTYASDKQSGFVNAILRKVAARGARLPTLAPLTHAALQGELGEAATLFSFVESDAVSESDDEAAQRLASTYSHPAWLVARWVARFGIGATERLLRWNNTRPPLTLQPARADFEALAAQLAAAGVETHPAPYGAGLVVPRGRPDALPGFNEGTFLVQDAAQALVSWYADIEPGSLVYDACAAPGGKALTAGRRARLVIAADQSLDRTHRLAANLARAGSGRERVIVADAGAPPVRPVDLVHLDAPCLGTGTFARHPDARHRVTERALAELAAAQHALLDALVSTVRLGGRLVYSTCSLEPEENAAQIDAFLVRHPDFRRDPNPEIPSSLCTVDGDLLLLPHQHGTDGAFCARLRRDG